MHAGIPNANVKIYTPLACPANLHLHVEKLARLDRTVPSLVVWIAVCGGALLLFGPCNGGAWPVLLLQGTEGQGLCRVALPPAFRVAKFVTGLVTLPEKIVR